MQETVKVSLREQIEAFRQQHVGTLSPEQIQKRRAAREQMLQSTTDGESLKVGDSAPDFTLPDAYGKPVTLATLLAKGPVVLTFYRGQWCPFCNLTLRAYQAILPEIEAHKGTLVAISPQLPDYTSATVQEGELTYPVLSDVGNKVARQYTQIWHMPEAERSEELRKYYGDESWELPAPGTFVIGQDGIVKLAYVDAVYTRRLEPAAVLEALRQLS
ncbi:MAG: AhpC/TSA family protein [Caldilineaceae bacterium]|nr:AhpC/TSA family protein [Caldilineaceae bacterium]